jgi:protein SCO1
MLVIFFVPFSFFYLFSLGSHQFGKLPFLGPDKSGEPFFISDFPITASNSDIHSFHQLKGKILIANVLTADCPYSCDLAVNQLKLLVLTQLIKQKKFSDVMIVSHLLDTFANPLTMAEKLKVNNDKWIVYHTNDPSLWDVELNGNVLSTTEDPERKGSFLFKRSILLIDKSMRIRGFYDGSQTIEIKRLLDELRLLMKEYETEK